jgi:hypothetical protein
MSLTRQIIIDFPTGLELPQGAERELVGFVEHLCKHYERAHPGRVMWAFGIGAYPVHIPLTDNDPRPMTFDDSVFHIEVSEREAYDWPCATCGQEQDQHMFGNTECAFVPVERPAYLAHRKAVRKARSEGVAIKPEGTREASKPQARATEHKVPSPADSKTSGGGE